MKKWAYYNDNEPYVCEWVRNLIRAGLIMDGEVDERDIRDIKPVELGGFIQVHMFCGIAGWALALRNAAWSDDREVWTGSAPCQPFSAAGKQRGFADDRHLWPYWRYLIAIQRPPTVLGEQVASAADWLRLVRGDLEALDYAVGAIPIEAASAGADHLRDRFWFVADQPSERLDGSSNPAWQARRDCVEDGSANGVTLGISSSERRAWIGAEPAHVEPGQASQGNRAGDGVAYADSQFGKINQNTGRSESGGGARPFAGPSGACDGDVGFSNGAGWKQGQFTAAAARHGDSTESTGSGVSHPFGNTAGTRWESNGQGASYGSTVGAYRGGAEYEWVLGADGKARRVKPGIRLLAHGVPARVAKLRALGNAIDPRPAAAFIRAALNLP